MKRLPRDQQKELADQARLMRAWKTWHAEQLDEALAGLHGAMVAELMTLLDRHELNSAAALLACVQRMDWSTVIYDVRLTALHQINQTISRLRERNGLAGIDDPLPGQPDNVFRRIKHMLFTPSPAKDDSSPSEVATAGRDVTATVSNRVSDDNE
jgi:hypothetical protein